MRTKSRSASAAAKHMLGSSLFAAAALAPLLARADMPAYAPVTTERLLNAQQDPGWLMYRRNYESTGYAPFDQISTANAATLAVAFDYESNLFQGHEAAPVVNGNYMFVTTPMDHLVALDAVSGKVLWKYDYPIEPKALKTVCCDVVNRGVALYGDLVYMGTLGNHIVALDAKTGTVKWDTALAPPGVGYFISGAPLVVDGKVIIGDGGGEYGSRGFVAALNAKTGQISSRKLRKPSDLPPISTSNSSWYLATITPVRTWPSFRTLRLSSYRRCSSASWSSSSSVGCDGAMSVVVIRVPFTRAPDH